MKKIGFFALGVSLLAGLAGNVQAGPIGYSVDTTSDELYQIDLLTGSTTKIGSVGFDDVEGLSFQQSTGILFGLDDATDQLITIDLTTGLGTAVGSLGFDFSDAGLTFDNAGSLFASSDLGDDGVYNVDPLTGAATLLTDPDEDPFGLAYFSGTAYGVSDDCDISDCLVSVNTTTGETIEIGELGINVDEGGLDFDAGGTLWFIEKDFDTVFTINTLTGLATAGATIDCKPDCGLESLAIRPVPEPASIALFGLGLVGIGLTRRKYQKI